MLTVVAFIATVFYLNNEVYCPEKTVDEYLQALARGDGESALGILNASVPKSNAAVLDGPALQQAAAAVTNVSIGDPVEADGGRVQVPVSYTIRDTSHSTTFTLEPGPTRWTLFDTWEFVPAPLPTVSVSAINVAEAALNGSRVALPGGQSVFSTFYPVELEAHYTSEYFSAPATTLPVTSAKSGATISLKTEATTALIEAVDTQLRAFLDDCTKQTVFQPTNCPFHFQTEQRLAGDISWSIAAYPEVRIAPNNGEWVMAPLAGTATLKTKLQDLFTGAVQPVTVDQDFGFTARLRVDESTVTVTPVVDY